MPTSTIRPGAHHRVVLVLAALVGFALTAGCAGIPTSGSPQHVRKVADQTTAAGPRGPEPGQQPEQTNIAASPTRIQLGFRATSNGAIRFHLSQAVALPGDELPHRRGGALRGQPAAARGKMRRNTRASQTRWPAG
jgi:hypothetical protein